MIELPPVLAELKTSIDQLLGDPPHVTGSHLDKFAALIDRARAIALIESVLGDPQTLERVARRSYTHTLGFKKIVLLDPPEGEGYGYQLRLHIWEPASHDGVPLVEAMHEHSFDFVSHMLHGEMENQTYTIAPLSLEELTTFQQYQARLSSLSEAEKLAINREIEILEAVRLTALGSNQASEEKMNGNREKLRTALAVSDTTLDEIVAFHGRYKSVSSDVSDGTYVHRLTDMVALRPHRVLHLKSGDTYHHPHQFAHRLYMRANQPNSTIILTTPVSQQARGGSFQRPSWVPGAEVIYARQLYTATLLERSLREYVVQLKAAPAANSSRQLDVVTAA